MSFLKEFKTFAMRGNVVDMAVGIIIGGAFGKIVSSLVSDIIMPPIGLLIGGVKFESLKIVLKHAHTDAVTGKVTEGDVPGAFYMTDSFYPRTIHLTDIQPTAGIHGFYCSHYNYPYRKHYSTPDYNGPRT